MARPLNKPTDNPKVQLNTRVTLNLKNNLVKFLDANPPLTLTDVVERALNDYLDTYHKDDYQDDAAQTRMENTRN